MEDLQLFHSSRPGLKGKLEKIFETSKSQVGQQALVESTKKLYFKQEDKKLFIGEFIDVLKYALVYSDKTSADRMLQYVSKFTASLHSYQALNDSDSEETEMEHPFVSGLFDFIFKTHSAALMDVRLRCTTLVNYILTAMPDDSWLPVSIWNGLAEMTRSRLQDRNANVRVAAVLIARKLQEPKDPKCEIVKLLSFHMADPSPVVRRAVISSIALSKVTIVDVIARTLDVNENVRRNAYAVIAKVNFKNLTISQRVTLLERGLKDRAERVKYCVETVLLAQWLTRTENDVLKLMEGLDAVNCFSTIEMTLDALTRLLPIEDLVKCLPLDYESHLISVEHINPETALLWRFVVKFLAKSGLTDLLESVLPAISDFTEFLKSWYPGQFGVGNDQWEEVKKKRILIHLLELASAFDLSDEMGRTNLKKLIVSMLVDPFSSGLIVDNLVDLLHVVVPETADYFRCLMETISDIREPLNQMVVVRSSEEEMNLNYQIADLKVTLNELREKEYKAVQDKEYTEAADMNARIKELMAKIESLSTQSKVNFFEAREEKSDPETLCKCLRIVVKMIPASGVKELTPTLRSLKDELLAKCLASEDLLTQSLAIKALAQFCILDKTLAHDHLLSFLFMLSEHGDNDVNIPALKAVFDILQAHGLQCFEKIGGEKDEKTDDLEEEEDLNLSQVDATSISKPAAKCMAVLTELLKCSENDALKKIAFEGFCKLLVTEVVYSPSLLKNIIIKGFTPIRGNECEDQIRQLFMVFFPMFARNTARSQEMIESAFMPVMRVLSDAPFGSPECDISARDVAAFLIDSTKPGINKYTRKTVHVHNALALSICHEILREASLSSEQGLEQIYMRCLLQLDICHESESYTEQLLTLITKIKRVTKDPNSLRMVKQIQIKFIEASKVVRSVQNTLESTQQSTTSIKTGSNGLSGSESHSSSFFTHQKHTLEIVPETKENTTILENSTSSEAGGLAFSDAVIAESPEVSDASEILPTED